MKYLLALAILFVSVVAFGQDFPYSSDPATDAALSDLQSQAFYLQTGMTPGDMAKMTPAQQQVFLVKWRCDSIHNRIDAQLAMENAGHVGFDDWHFLRAIEKQDCPSLAYEHPYKAGVSSVENAEHAALRKRTGDTPMPPYPIEAARAGHQGKVMVRAEVAADGSVTNAIVYQSSGFHELDRAAVDAVREWHLDPAKGSSQVWPVNFSLNVSH